MFKYQPIALETMYTLLDQRTPLNPRRYTRGMPAVVKAVYEYFDNLLVGGEQDLHLIGHEVVLEFTRQHNEVKVTFYKGEKHRHFMIGGMNWSIQNTEDTQEHFFGVVLTSMMASMEFVKAIDASAKHAAHTLPKARVDAGVGTAGKCCGKGKCKAQIIHRKRRTFEPTPA